jgi:hypothetical protein
MGMDLHIQAVLQSQDAKFIFGQFAGQTPANLVAKLCDALACNLVIKFIVPVHNFIFLFSEFLIVATITNESFPASYTNTILQPMTKRIVANAGRKTFSGIFAER